MTEKRQEIVDAAAELRGHLTKTLAERLDTLVGALDGAGKANLGFVYRQMYPDLDLTKQVDRAKASTAFRKFCQLVHQRADDQKIALRIETDNFNQTPPDGRAVWIEVQPFTSVAVTEQIERNIAADIAADVAPTAAEVPIRGTAYKDQRRRVRYSVVYSGVQRERKDKLLNGLASALALHGTSRFILETEVPVQKDGTWLRNVEAKAQQSDLVLVLLSRELIATGFLAKTSIPLGKMSPVALERFDANVVSVKPFAPEDLVCDEEGRAFAQSLKTEDGKNAFLYAVGREMDRRLQIARGIAETSHEAALDGELKTFIGPKGVPTNFSNKDRDRQGKQASNDDPGEDALRFLFNWIVDPAAPNYCVLLGEYGVGKTTLSKAFAREIYAKRNGGEDLPIPLYFDLRSVGKAAQRGLDLQEILGIVIQETWKSGPARTPVTAKDITTLVERHGAVIIWDGLDEVMVHLDPQAGQLFTRQLYRLVPPSQPGDKEVFTKPASRLLVTCRTHYFRTLPDQNAHFRAEDRDNLRAENYRALLLLPFNKEQIEEYIKQTLPDYDPSRVIETIDAIHNLNELATRPYTLSLIVDHFTEIERWKAEGRRVTGVTLYRLMVDSWFTRDNGKHQLLPADKLELMEEIAARLWRTGERLWSITEVERWLDEYLHDRPLVRERYTGIGRSLLYEDLRTATFLVREGESKFRFAHSSLQEYFLACYLRRALVEAKPERWELPKPSTETLDFLGQLLVEEETRNRDSAVATLMGIRKRYRAQASENAFFYCLLVGTKEYPACAIAGFQLPGAKLRGLELGVGGSLGINLAKVDFQDADLRDAAFHNVNLEAADFSRARLDHAEFLECRLHSAKFSEAAMEGALLRKCNVTAASYENAVFNRTRFIDCKGQLSEHHDMPQMIVAPTPKLPLGALAEFGPAHVGPILACAWSPDGTRVVSASDDNTLRIWDAGSGEVLLRLTGHEYRVTGCAWSPDGTRVVSASYDKTLRIWDAGSGEVLLRLTGHEDRVTGCAWSPDGTRVVSASDDNTLRIWDAGSGEVLLRLTGHEDRVTGCAWSPDGTRVVSASADNTLRIWDAGSGEVLLHLSGHENGVKNCAWSPDGTRVVSASGDKTLRIWDAGSGEVLLRLTGHEKWVNSCAWSPDGTRVVSASYDKTLRIWDAGSGEVLLRLTGHEKGVWGCAWSPDGTRVVSASYDNTLRIWDAGSGEVLLRLSGHENGVMGCAWSPDGTRVVSASDDNTLRIWDAGSGEVLLRLTGHEDRVTGCAWSPDGTRVVSASWDNTLRIWDAGSGEVLLRLSGHENWVRGCAWSPDGTRVVSASEDNTLRIWDAGSGEVLLRLSGHENAVLGCAWSPDGTRVVSASDDNTLRIWDAGSGEVLLRLSGHENWVNSCAWSPDGTRVVSASDDNTLRIWDAGSGEVLLRLSGHENWVWGCAWSPDGTRVVSASYDNTLRIWDAGSGEVLLRLSGHENWVWGCAWSPDGTRVVSASGDNTLRIWDATTGRELGPTMYHFNHRRGGPTWAAVDRPSNRIVACGADAWRHLGWIVPEPGTGLPVRVPAEMYGPLPVRGW